MNDSSEPKPKRRVRYKGKHPRKFSEKYKELNPEKYQKDLQKVIERGATPVGTHRPVCVDEILEILKPKPGDKALDATLGFGGHSQEILKRILPKGRLIALDQDPIERPKTEARLRALDFPEKSLVIGSINFREAKNFLKVNKLGKMDLVLADLGLSSMQIDNPDRGFTFKQDGPFDLRMNPSRGQPASALLKELDQETLQEMLIENSDEPHARQIAAALVKYKPQTTLLVAKVVRDVVKTFSAKVRENEGNTPIKRVFQTLRIAVNEEFEALDQFLEELPDFVERGGRIAILSFHSGEDRRVKKAFQAGHRTGVYSQVAPEFIRPSFEEQRANPRAAPAKLRWAIRS
ncbi:MAG: 16S rRNA (cytosine(1402)-N(4))-methyltransferase RsmH [Bdellovibrionales bacterium]